MWLSALLVIGPSVLCGIVVISNFATATRAALWVGLVFIVGGTLYCLTMAHIVEPGILITERDLETGMIMVVMGTERAELIEYRAKFCRETNTCVERFDHFCPWVGNAVGARNYGFFFLFVTGCVLNAIYVNAVSWADIAHHMQDSSWDAFRESSKDRLADVFLIIYTIIIALCISPLFGYHCWLISNNQTTNENLKGVYGGNATNPHDLGCFANWMVFFSMICRRRETVKEASTVPMTEPT